MAQQQRCAACHRWPPLGDKYCIHHSQALQSLKEHYKAWVEAYGDISWNNFIDRIAKMDETGQYIKEVIELERKS